MMFHRFYDVLIAFSLFLVGCSSDLKKSPSSCSLTGELTHIQYWNKYDKWDLSSIYVILQYDDGSIEKIIGNSSRIEYSFNYNSPSGMAPGAYELVILDSYFCVSKSEKINLGSRNLGIVNIIDYPYSGTPQELIDSGIFLYIFSVTTIFLILAFLTVHIIKKKKGTKTNDIK